MYSATGAYLGFGRMGTIPLEESFAFKILKKFDSMRDRVEHFIAVINLCPLPAFICSRDAQDVLFVNPAFTRLTGKTLECVQQMGWLSIVHPEDREKVAASWADYSVTLKDNETVAWDRRYQNGGVTFEAKLYTTPLPNDGVVGYIVPKDCSMLLALGIDLNCPNQRRKLAPGAGYDPATTELTAPRSTN